jgi:hypothetical protein
MLVLVVNLLLSWFIDILVASLFSIGSHVDSLVHCELVLVDIMVVYLSRFYY